MHSDQAIGKSPRIGLFGGTFDPVHFGHLRPAVELAEAFELDTLFLLPNHRPAHRGPARASTEHRIAMLKLAIRGTQRLAIDAREALRDKPSYTFDTLSEIHREQPQASLVFFMGLDAFAKFDTWHNWQGVLELANLVIVHRPGARHSSFSASLLEKQQARCGGSIRGVPHGVIEECDVTQLAISATDVRRRISGTRTVRFLLPEAVSEYITSQSLYRAPSSS
ncbi:MAG: nicotinate-nucleotide adenylyltransferase [Granulosicoccus sp.]